MQYNWSKEKEGTYTEDERWASLQHCKGGHHYIRASRLQYNKERSAKTEQKMDSIPKSQIRHLMNRAKVGTITTELVGSNATKKRSAKTEQR